MFFRWSYYKTLIVFPVKLRFEGRRDLLFSLGSDIQTRIIHGTQRNPSILPGADAGASAKPPGGANDSFLSFRHPRPHRPDPRDDDGASSTSCAASAGSPGPRAASPGSPTHPASPSRYPDPRPTREGESFLNYLNLTASISFAVSKRCGWSLLCRWSLIGRLRFGQRICVV